MDRTGNALATAEGWLRAVVGVLVGIFGIIETALHQALSQAGVPGSIQSVVILVAMVLFILAVVRLFGGLFRVLLVVFLVLLVLHVLLPNAGF